MSNDTATHTAKAIPKARTVEAIHEGDVLTLRIDGLRQVSDKTFELQGVHVTAPIDYQLVLEFINDHFRVAPHILDYALDAMSTTVHTMSLAEILADRMVVIK